MGDVNQAKQALQAVLEGRTIAYHVAFARLAGSVTAGVFLSQLFYWTGRGADPEGWIFKTRDEWREETGLTRREQETARRRLRQVGVIEEERRGVPARLFYRANLDKLIELLAAQRQDPSSLVPTRKAESAQLGGRKAPNKKGGNVPTNSEKTQRRQTEKTDGDGGQSGEKVGTDLLIEFGVSRAVAEKLATQCSAEDITGWLSYARGAAGLADPPAFVVRRLLDGEAAPEAQQEVDRRQRYLGGEYGELLQH